MLILINKSYLRAEEIRGVSWPRIDWERKDIHEPAECYIIFHNKYQLPVLEFGYMQDANVPLYR